MQKEMLVQIQCARRMGVCTGAGAHVGRRNATVLRRPDVYVTQCVNGIDPLHEGEGQGLQALQALEVRSECVLEVLQIPWGGALLGVWKSQRGLKPRQPA